MSNNLKHKIKRNKNKKIIYLNNIMTLLIILIVISNYVYLLLTNCKTIKIKHIYTYLTTG